MKAMQCSGLFAYVVPDPLPRQNTQETSRHDQIRRVCIACGRPPPARPPPVWIVQCRNPNDLPSATYLTRFW